MRRVYFVLLSAFLMLLPVCGQADVPSGEPASGSDVLQSSRMLGPWFRTSDGGLRLGDDGRARENFWVYREKASRDGILRATVELGHHPDFSLLFRASFPEDLSAVDAYSLSVHWNNIQLHRWEGGYQAPVTAPVRIQKMPRRIEIEVAILGTKFDIRVFDAGTREECASLSMDDASLGGLEIGFRASRKQDGETSLRSIEFTGAKKTSEAVDYADPDAYLRQHPFMFVVVPDDRVGDLKDLSACRRVPDANVGGHSVFRCSHPAMMELVDSRRMLPEGVYWTEPRHGFIDEEFRTASAGMDCAVPMRCDASVPLDPNRSAKDADMSQAYLDAYGDICRGRYKHVRIETLGTTYLGHEMRAIVLSNADPGRPVPRVLFNGAHHGIELLAADMAFDVLEQLCETPDPEKEKWYARLLGETEVWIVPVVNLDGTDMFFNVSNHLGRKNGRGVFVGPEQPPMPARSGHSRSSGYYRYHPNGVAIGEGVDLNRNYPLRWGATGEVSSSGRARDYWYRGAYAASEPEVQAMMNLFHVVQFASSVSFHTVSTRILSPYSIDALRNPPHDADAAWQLALRMSEAAGVQAGGRKYEVVKNLYSVDGTDQDWFRMVSGTYAYLIEGPLHNPTGEKRRAALEKNRPAWETLLDASATATVVRVRDASGAPVMAEVRYSDVPRLNGEHWMTRASDGTHVMLCTGDRRVTVVYADGTEQTKAVSCHMGRSEIVDFTSPGNSSYMPERAFCAASGGDLMMMGIDAVCDIRRGGVPHLPAQRYCMIGGHCVSAGVRADLGAAGTMVCDPRENNRGWTFEKK